MSKNYTLFGRVFRVSLVADGVGFSRISRPQNSSKTVPETTEGPVLFLVGESEELHPANMTDPKLISRNENMYHKSFSGN